MGALVRVSALSVRPPPWGRPGCKYHRAAYQRAAVWQTVLCIPSVFWISFWTAEFLQVARIMPLGSVILGSVINYSLWKQNHIMHALHHYRSRHLPVLYTCGQHVALCAAHEDEAVLFRQLGRLVGLVGATARWRYCSSSAQVR